MTTKTPLLIPSSLAARLELVNAWRGAGYCQAVQHLHPQAGSQVLEVAGGLALYAGVDYPVRSAIGLGMSAPVGESDLDLIENFYAGFGLPPRIHSCPFADPSLQHLLDQRSYSIDRILTTYFCHLPAPHADLEMSTTVTVTVATQDQASLWVRTTAQGFCETEEPEPVDLEVMMANYYAPNGTCFLAWIDGQPAGGAGMFIHAGAVELGGASTRLQFRRRGVHSALLKARMETAYISGCDLAVVVTSPGSASQRNLERLGFSLAYSVPIYMFPKT